MMEQIELVYDSPLAKKFMPKKPRDVSEFRQLVPLTTYEDYATYLGEQNQDALAVEPLFWGHTSGRGGRPKWVFHTQKSFETFYALTIAIIILACATRKGEVNVGSDIRLLQTLPAPPYMSGIITPRVAQRLGARLIPPPDKYENADFETKIQAGFAIALRTGADFLTSLTSVLVKMGERFTERSGQFKFSRGMLHPQIMWRLTLAWLRSKKERRAILPKDLWPLKGLICFGTDTSIYKEQLIKYWGEEPLETYGATEIGLIATQAWNKKNLTFFPSSCFLEFVPEAEWLKNRDNKDYQPSSILLNEVKSGERYEIITTNFHGMPFLRYRLGDLIKVVALADEEASIKLPQIVFDSRADDLIDIAGFPRLDERTIWQAIANTGIKYADWSARKEFEQNEPIIRLYIELKETMEVKELEKLIHQELATLNQDYSELESMLGKQPLRITPVAAGNFQRYYEEKRRSGADLAHLKPPHMNASDDVIQNLVKVEPNSA